MRKLLLVGMSGVLSLATACADGGKGVGTAETSSTGAGTGSATTSVTSGGSTSVDPTATAPTDAGSTFIGPEDTGVDVTTSEPPPPPPPACGDGVQTPDESCDLGAMNADDGVCTTACTVAHCGDGEVHAGVEACDDGNAIADDGCDNACGLALEFPARPRLVSGLNHTCALSDAGALRCWGGSDAMIGHGQTGYGHLESVGDEPGEMPPPDVAAGGPVAQIAAAGWSTCAVLGDGSVRCWGNGERGQLGNGSTGSIGDEPGEMPPPPIALGGPAIQVSTSGGHTCALLVDGAVRCWGDNFSRQLGFDSDSESVGDEPGEMPPPPVPLPRKVVQIAAVGDESCALLESGTLMCWGGYDVEAPPTVVAIGGPVVEFAGRCVRLAGGAVRCWGGHDYDNSYGELGYGHVDPVPAAWSAGDVAIGGTAVQVAFGGQHTCVVLAGGALRCWGFNPDGRLGYGDDENRGDEPGEMPTADVAAGGPVAEVALGYSFTCARLENGEHRCWGWGDPGQLGLGHKLTIGDEPGEMPPPIVPVF